MKVVLEASGKKIASGSELKRLAELERQWRRDQEVINTSGEDSARKEWKAQHEKLKSENQTGQYSGENWSLEDFVEDFQERARAAKADQLRICRETLPLALEISEKFHKAAMDLAADIEKTEMGIYSRFLVGYSTSPVVEGIRHAANAGRHRVQSVLDCRSANSPPSMLMPYLDFTN